MSPFIFITLSSNKHGAATNPNRLKEYKHGAAREASKWEKITYVGIVACSILAFVNLSKGHPHFEEPPAYPYMHIRNKEFQWGKRFVTLAPPNGCFVTLAPPNGCFDFYEFHVISTVGLINPSQSFSSQFVF